MNRSCLIIIDMQNGVFKLKDGVYKAEAIINNSEICIKAALERNIKVILTQHENKSFLKRNYDDWDIISRIKKYSNECSIFYKKHPGIYGDTGLKSYLHENDITNIYIGGLISNGCIKDACMESFEYGYDVYLIDDCHSTIYKNAQKIIDDVNTQMKDSGIKLISSASFSENK